MRFLTILILLACFLFQSNLSYAEGEGALSLLPSSSAKESQESLFFKGFSTSKIHFEEEPEYPSLTSDFLPFSFLLKDKRITTKILNTDTLTLSKAVNEALLNRWLFTLADEEVKLASRHHLDQWAYFLPHRNSQIDDHDFMESDAQKISLESGALKPTLRHRFSLNQLIFSDPAFRKVSNAQAKVQIEKWKHKSQELDIQERVIKAYFYYLKTKALRHLAFLELRDIQKRLDHLELKKRKLAIHRKNIFYWRSKETEAKAFFLKKESAALQARATLTQLISQTSEFPFSEQELGLELEHYYRTNTYLGPYLRNMKSLMVGVDFMVKQATRDSPEIQALDLAISQRGGNVRSVVSRLLMPQNPFTVEKYSQFQEQNQTSFKEGSEAMGYLQQRDELERLKFKRQLKLEEIEKNVRSSAYNIHHSLPAVELAYDAMLESMNHYDFIEKRYERGAASIEDFFLAGEDQLKRQVHLVESLFEFLNDLTHYERGISNFYMLQKPRIREDWLQSLKDYLEMKGVVAPRSRWEEAV